MRKRFLKYKTCATVIAALLLISGQIVQGATRTASVTGNWSSTTTWGGSAVPTSADAVVINSGVTVTVDGAAVCASVTINAASATNGITISGTNSLTVSGAITMNAAAAAVNSTLSVGAGTMTAASISIAGSPTSGRNTQLTLSTGTIDCSGSVTFSGTAAQARLTFSGAGVLFVGGALGTGGTFTASTGTVNYDALAVQTIGLYTYYNLTLSGSSAKTFPTGTTTINGTLSMEGTATATVTGTLTYGASMKLQYNNATARTAGSEWKTPFTATGGVVIANTGTVTLNTAKVFNAGIPLTINTGATLATANFGLTFNGDFINSGTLTAGSTAVTITGTSPQNIGPFTTTGAISITKTTGTINLAGNVNAASLSLSTGTTGTTALSLNTGVTITLTGTLTVGRPSSSGTNRVLVNDGTLTCGAMSLGGTTTGSRITELNISTGTVNVSGNITTGGGASHVTFTNSGVIKVGGTFMTSATPATFTSSTGTVNYFGSGAQSIIPLTYNNLTLSNAGVKTFASGTTTVNGILSIEGAASTAFTGTLSYGSSATLQYKVTDAHTTGTEWPATFSGTGGIAIVNSTGSVTLSGAKTISAASQLIIGNGTSASVFSDGGYQVTCTGALNFNSGTFKLGGSSATTFPAFSSIIIDPGAAVEYCATVAQTVSAEPSYSNLTLTGSSKTIGTSAGATLTVGNNLLINSGATYLGSTYNPVLNIGGNFTNSGIFTQGTGLVTFNGTVAQSIYGTATFNNLTFYNTSAAVTSMVNLAVANGYHLSIEGGATFIFSGAILTIGHDFINNGSFDPGTGTAVFSGNTSQRIRGQHPTTFNDLTINNSLGVTMKVPVTVEGTLTLTTGEFITGSNTLTFQNSDTPIVQTGGTIATSISTDLIFGTEGNTGGSSFSIPDGTFTASPVINNLTINRDNTLMLNDQVLSAQGVVLCNGPLNTNDNLKLVSTASQTALIDGSGTGSITGNVTMQRYLETGFGYKYFSSPFQTLTVNDFAGYIDLSASFPAFYNYDENATSSGWMNFTDGSGSLDPLFGYAGNMGNSLAAETIELSGVINSGTIGPVTMYNHHNTYTLGFNLAGNPYPSPIDWDAPSGWTRTNIDDAIYYFDNGTADQYTGTYSTYINGVSSDGIASNIIAPMQGFFIHVSNGTYPVTAQFGTTNSVRVNYLSPVFHKPITEETRPLLRLSATFDQEGALADPLVIYFDDTASVAFDKKQDALKLINTDPGIPSLFAFSSDGMRLSIDAVPEPSDSVTIIPIGVKTFSPGYLMIKPLAIERIRPSLKVYLFDALSKIYTDFSTNHIYRCFVGEGNSEGRFSIVFSEKELQSTSSSTGDFSAYSSRGKICVNPGLAEGETAEIRVFNMLGQLLCRQTVMGSGVTVLRINPGKGVYIAELDSSGRKKSQKVLITGQ
jgi:fibronectin-binding autotransporter adhesin